MAAGTLGNPALTEGEVPRESVPPAPEIARVYESHFKYVWRCLRSLGVRDAVLDDALQDVFLVVQKKLPCFEGRAQLRTWLYAIALRVARRYRAQARRERDRAGDVPGEALSEPALDAEGKAENNERLTLARAALGVLDDDKREVFVLARIEQMSAPEIATIIGIPVNTVYSRLRAAREAFEAEVRRLQARRKPLP